MGINSTKHAFTHRNKTDNAANKEQTFKSLHYQDSLRDAIQVIIKKLDEKIESTNQSKLISHDIKQPINNSGINLNQEGSLAEASKVE